MNKITWMIIATIIAIIPVYFIKKYIMTNNYFYIIITIFLYMILLYSYINLFTLSGEIMIVYTILQILQILLVVMIGMLIFNEKLTIKKIIGIVTGCISIYFLSN